MASASASERIPSISSWTAGHKTSTRKASEEFGSLTFNDEAQRARLPKDVYRALRRAVAQGEPIEPPSPTSSPARSRTGPSSTAPRTTPTGSSR